MKLLSVAFVTVAVLSVAAVGCRNKVDDNDDDGDTSERLGTAEAQLIEEDAESADVDADLEVGLDDATSGATQADPGDPADGASDEEVGEKIRKNAGAFFKPAGCLVSTRNGNTIAHVFKGCSGPFGLGKFDGSVTSTYVRAPGKLTITHEASGLSANGATISGTRVIEYTRAGGVITKKRTGSWSGKTAKGKDITHTANFVTTYDVAAKCLTRDGVAQTTINQRSFERTIDGFKRCGIGRVGCPEVGGKVTLSRTKSDETLTLTLEFLGGRDYKVTRPNGKEITRSLLCNPRA